MGIEAEYAGKIREGLKKSLRDLGRSSGRGEGIEWVMEYLRGRIMMDGGKDPGKELV